MTDSKTPKPPKPAKKAKPPKPAKQPKPAKKAKQPKPPRPAAPRPSLPARIFGAVLLAAGAAALVGSVWSITSNWSQRETEAVVPHVTELAPLKELGTIQVPKPLIDTRKIYAWPLANNEALLVINGTDGKQAQGVAMKVSLQDGRSLAAAKLPAAADYCLPQLWSGRAVCEVRSTKQILTIGADPFVKTQTTDHWDLATGPTVIAGVYDKYLMLPLAVGDAAGAGVQTWFFDDNMTPVTFPRYTLMIPGAQGVKPMGAFSQGGQVLAGVAAAKGDEVTVTWGFALSLLNMQTLDTSGLGANSWASMLSDGYFASADPGQLDAQDVHWKVFDTEGKLQAEGDTPKQVAQVLHDSLRAGHLTDSATAADLLTKKQAPVILADGTIFSTPDTERCIELASCATTEWFTESGKKLTLKSPGRPLFATSDQVLFNVSDTFAAFDFAGNQLWRGALQVPKGSVSSGAPTPVGDAFMIGSQFGKASDPGAHAAIKLYGLPDASAAEPSAEGGIVIEDDGRPQGAVDDEPGGAEVITPGDVQAPGPADGSAPAGAGDSGGAAPLLPAGPPPLNDSGN